ASGGLVAVARTTPDYRFPVSPATAVARFHDARDRGHAPALSLFSVDHADAARLLETTFYAECLKLHVDGPASAALVADQLARCGCQAGILEANDYSDPAAPAVRLVELGAEPLDLEAVLAGVAGRVLLYDRAKNKAVAGDRQDPLDLDAAIAQADRLARARKPSEQPPEPAPTEDEPPTSSDLEDDLRQRAERPSTASPLSALVAELQGRTPAPEAQAPEAQERSHLSSGEPGEGSATAGAPASPAGDTATADEPGTQNPEPQAPLHPLALELDRLRSEVVAVFEDAVGRDRARDHHDHVAKSLDLEGAVPPEHTVPYLRALLTADPPRRWHLFKRARGKITAQVADKLLAFHGAHAHVDSPAVQHAAQLWTRLHR
ncbi:MAG: hypothetical protein WBA11_00230, partial [Rubrivirga sp.]